MSETPFSKPEEIKYPQSVQEEINTTPEQTKKELQELSKEDMEKIMEKIVDLKDEEDLKYRDMYDIHGFMVVAETGLATPITDFLLSPEGKLDSATKEKLRKSHEKKRPEKKIYQERSANVFYPEGSLKLIFDVLDGKKQDFSSIEFQRNSIEETQERAMVSAIKGIKIILRDLHGKENFTGIDEEERIRILNSIKKVSAISTSEELIESIEALRPILDLDVSRELFRKEWLKMFFESIKESSLDPLSQSELVSYDSNPWIFSQYRPHLGFILSHKTKVITSYSGDYPSEAVIASSRVPPREFEGVFINTFANKSGASEYESVKLEKYRIPANPLKALIEYSSRYTKLQRPFSIFIENQGFKINISDLKERLNSITKSLFDKATQPYNYQELNESVWNEFCRVTGTKQVDKLEELAKRFFQDKSPIREGDSMWEALVSVAQKRRIPIYSLNGDILWPKQINHEEVKKFIEGKEGKKELEKQ